MNSFGHGGRGCRAGVSARALGVVSLAAAGALLASFAPWRAGAQSAVIRGTVVDPVGGPLGYSIVSLDATDRSILTDELGRFVIVGLEAGGYHLRARHLGYLPLDTTVTITAGDAPYLELRLTHLTVQLSTMRVVAPGPCVHPGPPDPAIEPTLAAIFGQLRDNAERAVALGRQFPFVFQMERRFSVRSTNMSARPIGTDTTVIDGTLRWPYRPGHIVTMVNDRGHQVRQLNIPGLVQLADSAFHASHCFSYGGVEELNGAPYIRVDFEPDEGIDEPEITGSAYLDTAGYQVQRIVMSLTRTSRLDPYIVALRVTSSFREIVPSIVILDSAEGVTSFEMPGGGPQVRTERQKTVKVIFVRGTPPGTALP